MKHRVIKPITWKKFEKLLMQVDCVFVRQKGGHRIYNKTDLLRPTIVPAHSGDLPVFIIKNNLKTLGISEQEYLDCMNA